MLAPLVCLLLAASCASISVKRTGPDSGTFHSTALAFTFFSYDMPGPALTIARANAADSGRPGLIVEHESVFPYLWKLDWLLDIIGIRYASVSGTWSQNPAAALPER
ncbi:MAG TPA: hypothetical protein ENJ09_07445 [Planctomycetes bacterium]|nr:hypothetical protein [Planctomycetota bacterium]